MRRVVPLGWRFLTARKGVLVRLAGWSVLESAGTFLGGYCLARGLDQGFLAGRTGTGLGWLAVAGVAILLGGPVVRGVFAQLASLVEPLRDGLVRRAVGRSLEAAVAGPARVDGTAVSRLTHQTEIVRDSFAGLVLTARSFVFTAVGALAGLLALAPEFLLIVVPPLALGLGLFLATLVPMAGAQRAFLDLDEAVADRAGALGAGLRDITACGTRAAEAERTERLIEAAARASRVLARWAAFRTLALGVAGQVPVFLLLAATPWLVGRGVTAGALMGALAYLVQSLLPALHTLMTALGAAGTRLLVVLDRFVADPDPDTRPNAGTGTGTEGPGAPRISDGARGGGDARDAGDVRGAGVRAGGPGAATPAPGAAPGAAPGGAPRPVPLPRRTPPAPSASPPRPAPPAPAAEVRGVTVAYGPGAPPVLDGLDLTVGAGEHLAVVGPSGIGKSTLAGVVAGMLTPGRGAVALSGVPVAGRGARELAALRVLVPQEAYVFTGTVRENLRQARPDVSPYALVRAVEALGADALVGRLGGLDATVRPGGLSQGERQLLALCRAYVSAAPLLILDEATCHLDPAAEARAEEALAARPGALVVVAHRLSSARRADRVLVLDGTRPECGTHEELLSRSALYRDLTGHWATDGAAGP
ncbi:ABC transporter ATP-binding protein [Streptomyces sp. NPDC093085]|uniref:ABC transporter ATP-binding protein n=1 Tax=Streptomyces sp. NPDC093085 TaxID=3155068 RepID=UPI003442540C